MLQIDWAETREEQDALALAKGIVIGAAIASAIWAIVLMTWRLL